MILPSLLLFILALLANGAAQPEIKGERTLVAATPDEYFTHVELDKMNQKLKSYSNERMVEIDLTTYKLMRADKITQEEMVTDSVMDGSGGRIDVVFKKQCIKQYSATGQQIGEVIKCSRTKSDILAKPYGVAFKTNGEISYTDELANQVVTIAADGSKTFHTDASLVRPRGIVYDADTDRHYVAVTNGIVSLEDKTVISGVAKEYNEDGSPAKSIYDSPHDIEVVRPGLLVVADYSNRKIQLVDLDENNKVTTLCTTGGRCDFGNVMSVAVSTDLKKMYVATDTGVLVFDVEGLKSKKNLCYGLSKSGVATIRFEGEKFQAWCDVDSPEGPWLTILKRYDGSVNFRQNFATYEKGFGDVSGEYWLGLDKIHRLTKNKRALLRIDVEQEEPTLVPGLPPKAYAIYRQFWLGDRSTDYTLEQIDGYKGTAGDMETTGRLNTGGPHKGQKFSTPDKDFDEKANAHCADSYNGGWWMRQCYTVCLTCGPYRNPPQKSTSAAPIYAPFTIRKVGLIGAEMKLKLPEDMI